MILPSSPFCLESMTLALIKKTPSFFFFLHLMNLKWSFSSCRWQDPLLDLGKGMLLQPAAAYSLAVGLGHDNTAQLLRGGLGLRIITSKNKLTATADTMAANAAASKGSNMDGMKAPTDAACWYDDRSSNPVAAAGGGGLTGGSGCASYSFPLTRGAAASAGGARLGRGGDSSSSSSRRNTAGAAAAAAAVVFRPDVYLRGELRRLLEDLVKKLRAMQLPLPEGGAVRLMGVPDPTGSVPQGCVVVMGGEDWVAEEVLIYRDPGE